MDWQARYIDSLLFKKPIKAAKLLNNNQVGVVTTPNNTQASVEEASATHPRMDKHYD